MYWLYYSITVFPQHYIPSVLIFKAVLTKANNVALKVTVPSLFRGMFIEINRWGQKKHYINTVVQSLEDYLLIGFPSKSVSLIIVILYSRYS